MPNFKAKRGFPSNELCDGVYRAVLSAISEIPDEQRLDLVGAFLSPAPFTETSPTVKKFVRSLTKELDGGVFE